MLWIGSRAYPATARERITDETSRYSGASSAAAVILPAGFANSMAFASGTTATPPAEFHEIAGGSWMNKHERSPELPTETIVCGFAGCHWKHVCVSGRSIVRLSITMLLAAPPPGSEFSDDVWRPYVVFIDDAVRRTESNAAAPPDGCSSASSAPIASDVSQTLITVSSFDNVARIPLRRGHQPSSVTVRPTLMLSTASLRFLMSHTLTMGRFSSNVARISGCCGSNSTPFTAFSCAITHCSSFWRMSKIRRYLNDVPAAIHVGFPWIHESETIPSPFASSRTEESSSGDFLARTFASQTIRPPSVRLLSTAKTT
eukprot:comp19817_c0_seq1/m.38361 comp19817_c0_seq1/g.38361  ORF comp19817_c0_seq1/g.38361 comp19817_c0_seq1/m.38361 type:complete len:315 (+) comp19817_c0_seq1:125-1069(+)